MMIGAILFTAMGRPDVLQRTLDSWSQVRGIRDWFWYFSVEPTHQSGEIVQILKEFISRNKLPQSEVYVQQSVQGVLHHPWVGFETLFSGGWRFVIRAEDDLCVSDDILEYFNWAEVTYRDREDVATIHAYTDKTSKSASNVEVVQGFNPWVWGTWKDRWESFMRDTWDHDYSTFNLTPMNESGWDWNLETRVLPALGLVSVFPKMSRVDNIGIHGTHSTPENWRTAPTFHSVYGFQDYRET